MTAAQNMALDEALLELRGEDKSPNTIRFMQFNPPAVLVGFHQAVDEEVRTGYCRENGIEVNRRITGGGAIFFDSSQLGWEIICGKDFFNVRFVNDKLFRSLCEPVATALEEFGIDAVFRPRNDIEINGRKISGTGGTESYGAFLFQGTLLVDFDVDTMLKVLRIPVEKLKAKEIDSVKERVTCLKWELGKTPALKDIKRSIKKGFEKHLGIELIPGDLTDEEFLLFEKKLRYYRTPEWIEMVKPKIFRRKTVRSAYKTAAGMVRFTLVVDLQRKRVKDIYITGDFLSFPSRSLFDLESRLKGCPLDQNHIHEVIKEFFREGFIRIPGLGFDDFIKPLDQVFEKIAISEFGIPLEYCNLISVTNGSFHDVIQKKPNVLLLPYCSKLVECDLRYQKGCRACGECTVGEAWTMGLHRKMKNVCIVTYEDLVGELIRLKDKGMSAFIGCCCEPFFTKHVDDFKKVGVPGILLDIDNTTCYDLDQARAAYAGKFDQQTHLNLKLLKTVLDLNHEPDSL